MQIFRLIQWCEKATCRISFGPDRKKVINELMGHLADRRDALMAQGMDEREATEKALEAMGDAEEIAPQLGAIHRPFWGYALRVSKILLMIVLVISLLPIWNYFTKICNFSHPIVFYPFYVFHQASYGEDTGRILHHLSEPNVSFTSDGYHFTVTDAAMFTSYSESQEEANTQLYFLIDQRSSLPWTETEGYYNTHAFSSVCNQFTARDSLGNHYYSYTIRYPEDPALQVVNCQTGLFTGTYMCWINDFPKDAQWIEICYERDGRSFSLHIDLTGGAGK